MDDQNKKPNWSSVLEDNSGGFSSSRFICLLWSIGVFLIWGIGSLFIIIHSAGTTTPIITLLSLPPEVVTILLGVCGLKVVQRFGENEKKDS